MIFIDTSLERKKELEMVLNAVVARLNEFFYNNYIAEISKIDNFIDQLNELTIKSHNARLHISFKDFSQSPSYSFAVIIYERYVVAEAKKIDPCVSSFEHWYLSSPTFNVMTDEAYIPHNIANNIENRNKMWEEFLKTGNIHMKFAAQRIDGHLKDQGVLLKPFLGLCQ